MVPNDETKKLSRREALKALTAVSGAVLAGAMLPDKWARPVVGSGVLPAHAQASRNFAIVECDFYQSDSSPFHCSALISPVGAGIGLTCVWKYEPQPSLNVNGVLPYEGTILVVTDAVGIAFVTLPFSWNDYSNLYGKFSATWSFTNPLDGTGTCLAEITIIPQ